MSVSEHMLRKIIREEIRAHIPVIPALMKPVEVAKVLDVSINTLAKWRSLGQGPRYTKGGNIQYYAESVADYIEEHSS